MSTTVRRIGKIFSWVGGSGFVLWNIVRWLLDYYGYVESLRTLAAERGTIASAMLRILGSEWFPLAVFLVGIAMLCGFQLWRRMEEKKAQATQPDLYGHIVHGVTEHAREWARDEEKRAEQRRKAVEDCLDRYVQIHDDAKHLSTASLIGAEAHKLTSNDQLLKVCGVLKESGHADPIDYWGGYVPRYDALQFLRKVAYSPTRITNDSTGAKNLHQAMEQWRVKHGYPEPSEERRLELVGREVLFPSAPIVEERPPFRVSVLDVIPQQDNTEVVTQLTFINDSDSPRMVLSLRLVYWAPNRVWKNSFQLIADNADSMLLGDITKAFAVPEKSEQLVVFRTSKIDPSYLVTPGAEFGLHAVIAAEDGGEPRTVTFPVLVVRGEDNHVTYGIKASKNISLMQSFEGG